MAEEASAAKPKEPEVPKSWPTLDEVRATVRRVVERCRTADGAMPAEVFMQMDREEMRHLYAVDRYLDELDIIREGKKQARSSTRR